MEAAVFLDRDNTLIANDDDLGDPEQVRLKDGVPEGLKTLREAGYRLVVVTNQGGVARGNLTEHDVDAVHQRIAMLADEAAAQPNLIDRFYYCPYHPDAVLEEYRRDHPWRKPHPGMLLQAARDMDLDLARCWMIGDQARDIEAGHAAGCRTVLVSNDEPSPDNVRPTTTVKAFAQAVGAIIDSDPPTPLPHADHEWNDPLDEPDSHAADDSRTENRPDAAANREPLRRAIHELTDELRTERLRRAEFTGMRLAAGLCQLFAFLLALLGLLQLGSTDAFLKWMIGAALVQLLTIAILLLDLKG